MGLLSFLFEKILIKKVENDKELVSDIKDGDNYLDETKKWIEEQERDGNKVPDYLKKMVSKK